MFNKIERLWWLPRILIYILPPSLFSQKQSSTLLPKHLRLCVCMCVAALHSEVALLEFRGNTSNQSDKHFFSLISFLTAPEGERRHIKHTVKKNNNNGGKNIPHPSGTSQPSLQMETGDICHSQRIAGPGGVGPRGQTRCCRQTDAVASDLMSVWMKPHPASICWTHSD